MSGKGKGEVCVCVTGASGFIASHLVNLLLLRGYTVHATVRDLDDPTKTEHLKQLDGAKERLRLFKAELMEEGSFDAAIAGCQGVFHTASPVTTSNVTDPQKEIVDPAVKGTLNVLAACKRSTSVRRVVFTSSVSANIFTGTPRTSDTVMDETWFSKLEYSDEFPEIKWYATSKILAEEAAWNFCKENGIDLVAINPGLVIGPILQPTLNETVALVLYLINGTLKTYPNQVWPWVHVKDVAEAHIRAFEIPSAHGRYCLAESVHHFSEVLKLLRKLYPTLQIADKCDDDGVLVETYQVSQTKAKSLGLDFIPLEVSLKDTVENFKDKKFLAFRN